MTATGNSCLLADLKKSSLLKPLGQMNPNLETETNFQILPIYFFFGIKNVRVGRSIGNTPIFFLGLTDQDKMSNLHRDFRGRSILVGFKKI
jgi:hypothetical protein